MYDERAYFDGDHCQHVADYQEKHPRDGRLARIDTQVRAIVRERLRYGRAA